MQHSITEILICWSFIVIVDLSVAMFFIRLARDKEPQKNFKEDYSRESNEI